MTLSDFNDTLAANEPDYSWPVQLKSLWYDAKGDWKTAHDLIDHLEDRELAHVHAYLHRVEGDLWNARYWYNRAKQPECTLSIEQERNALIVKFLA